MSSRQNDIPQQFQQWQIPQVGSSPITGITGTLFWGGINRPDKNSRWVIGDSDLDDMPNFFPQKVQLQQLPTSGAAVTTLPSTAIWMDTDVISGNLFNYFLCQNGHIYQVGPTGTTTDVLAAGTFSQNGTLNGTTTVTGLTDTSHMFVGMQVTGTDIPPNTTIASVDSTTQIHISNAATGSGTFLLTFSIPPFGTIADISDWQGTYVLLSDFSSGNLYYWDGSTLKIALSNQPATFITVYGQRVWLFNGTTITWTQGGTFNSLAGDAGSATITDASAASPVTGAIAGLGVIIVFGSSWIASISNLIVSGSPAVLTFQFVVLSGQVGIGSKFGILPVGNSFYFANAYGIWDLQGSAPVKVSPQMDGFFDGSLNLLNTSFSAAYVVLYRTPCILWQAFYNGDMNVPAGHSLYGCTLVNNVPDQWFRVTQGTITLISSLPSNVSTGTPQPFGTDGTNVFPLFSSTASYQAQIFTKIWDFNSKLTLDICGGLFISALLSQGATNTTVSVAIVDETGQPVAFQPPPKTLNPTTGFWINQFGVQGPWINSALVTGSWLGTLSQAYYPLFFGLSGTMRGLGLNITVNGSGTIIQSLVVGYRDTNRGWGPPGL
jgi:hypothetical protein